MNIFIHCLLFFLSVSNATSKSTQQPLSFNDDRLILAKLRGRRLVPSPSLSRPPAATHHLNHQPGHPPGIPPPRPPTAGHHPPTAGHHPPTAGHHPPSSGHPPKAVVEHKVVVEPGRPVKIKPTKPVPPVEEFPYYNEHWMRLEDQSVNMRWNLPLIPTRPYHVPGETPNTDLLSYVPFTKGTGIDVHYLDANKLERMDKILREAIKKTRNGTELSKKDLQNHVEILEKLGDSSSIIRHRDEPGMHQKGKDSLDLQVARDWNSKFQKQRADQLKGVFEKIKILKTDLVRSDNLALAKERAAAAAGNTKESALIYEQRMKHAKEVGKKIENLEMKVDNIVHFFENKFNNLTKTALEGRKAMGERQTLYYQNLQEVLKLPGLDALHLLGTPYKQPTKYSGLVEVENFDKTKHIEILMAKDAPDRYLNIEESIGRVLETIGNKSKLIGEDMQYLFEDFLTVRLGANSARNNHKKSPFEEWNREVSTAELTKKFIPEELQRAQRRKQIREQDPTLVVAKTPAGESLDAFNTRLKQDIMEEFSVINSIVMTSGKNPMTTAQRRKMVDNIAHLSEILDVLPYAMKEFDAAQARINAQKMADEIKMAIKYHFTETSRIAATNAEGKHEAWGTLLPDVFNRKSAKNYQKLVNSRFKQKFGFNEESFNLKTAGFEKEILPLLPLHQGDGLENEMVYQFAKNTFSDRMDINIMKHLYGEDSTSIGRTSAARHSNLFPSQMESDMLMKLIMKNEQPQLVMNKGMLQEGESLYQQINKIADDVFNKFLKKYKVPEHTGEYGIIDIMHVPTPINWKAKQKDRYLNDFLTGFPTPPPKKAT